MIKQRVHEITLKQKCPENPGIFVLNILPCKLKQLQRQILLLNF